MQSTLRKMLHSFLDQKADFRYSSRHFDSLSCALIGELSFHVAMCSKHLLLLLIAAAFCFFGNDFTEKGEDNFCYSEGDCCALEEKECRDNEPHPHKWSRYLKLVREARENNSLDSISGETCEDTYGSVLAEDLRVWREKGGIEKEEFEQTKSLGVHYQIVDHKLYRQGKCVFGPRCVCTPKERVKYVYD